MTTTPTTSGARADTFIFIDSRVPDWQALVDALPPGSAWRLIDAGADGLAQIAQALAGQEGIQAVHILSHGAEGSVQLGETVLAAATLGAHAADLAAIGAALDADGDILLYGCDAGAGSAGAALVDTLALLTGADVAASTDATGAAALGGNWTLERSSGLVEARALGAGLEDWSGTLAASTTFDFGSGITGATTLTVPGTDGVRSPVLKQQLGDDTLALTADAGRLIAVDENEVLGDDAVFQGKLFVIDVVGNNIPTPQTVTLTLDGGKMFDLDAFSVADLYGTTTALTLRTSKGTVPVHIDTAATGQRVDLSAEPFLKGVTWVELSDPEGDPLVIALDDIALSNIHVNSAPAFETASATRDLAQNAAAIDIASLLRAGDADAGDTLTWSIVDNAQHGTATISGTATAPAGNAAVTPGGTLTYNPQPGFAGVDSIRVQVSDGSATTTKVITFNVAPLAPTALALDGDSDTGLSHTDGITGANTLEVGGASAVGDASSTVRVFIDQNGNGAYDAGEASATTTVRSDGTWSVPNLSTLGLDGNYNVYAVVTSASGALSSAVSAPLALTIDHTAPTITFAGIALSDVAPTGAADNTTNVAAQTIRATLSAAPQAGDVVQGSVDNGGHWTDITSMVAGTTLTWTGATLVAGGGIQLRVVDQHGNEGAATPQAYTLDQAAPTTRITLVVLTGDPDANYIVNDANQALNGIVSQNLGADEFVEVSMNGGASWSKAQVFGRSWALSGVVLDGSGTLVARVADKAGNHGLEFRQDYVLDQVAPTATVSASGSLAAPGGSSFTVVVTYDDTGAGIDRSSFNTANIGVTTPGGASLQVTGFAASGNVVTYTVQAPGGSWDPLDAGSYTVAVKGNAVRDNAGNTVAANAAAGTIDVLFSTAPAVGALALSDDNGSSDNDFLTNVAAQTIRATLSKALAAGDVVEGSLDNGDSWIVITDKVEGTALAWDTLLGSSGTIVVKVTDGNGLAGATASHAYTLDMAVPAQAIVDVAFSVDSGAAGDFITNVALQELSGKLGAPLGAGEFVEVSLDGGGHWTAASASGSDWSLAGITLSGSGTVQVRVSDAAGNHGDAWSHAYRVDTAAPTAGTPVRADLVDPAGASFTFTVTYADGGAGIDPATVGTGNVSVGGPGGALSVTNATLSGNTVTYTVQAPGGSWDPLDAGSYSIGINASVKDLAGNTVAADAGAHAFDVAFTPAAGVGALSLSDDTGASATDFLTNAAAQTIRATLSKALAGGDVVEGSLDNGGTWTVITDKVTGTDVDWDGVTLSGSGTIVIRVTGANGLVGATASHAYTLDTSAPAQSLTDVALSVDSGAAGDFITNVAAQELSGKLGAPLGAGEFVELSLDGGSHWTAAPVTGTDWSLPGITLSGSGTVQVRVSDAAGNHGDAWSHAYRVDTVAPTAGTPVRADLVDPAGASFTFTVTYDDGGAGIDPATVGTGNVSVGGPGGALSVTGAVLSGNTVTYTVAAPGGSWDPLDAGSYSIGINASVKDLAGNTVAAQAGAHAFDVAFTPAPSVGGLSLSDDTGASATDFLTNAAAQTIRATLSKALAGGDVVEGSLDNGATWTVITDKVAGTALAWDTLLGSSGTIVVKVTGANGLVGAMASHAYTLDTSAPAQAVTDVAFSVDSGAAGDFITNVAAQELSGKLGAPLAAGELVEVSLDGGSHWTAAPVTGTDWSLPGITLSGSGTVQVRVSDAAGNHGDAWSHAYRVDTVAPTAGTPVRADLVDPAGASFTFTVTYADGGAGIDPATVGTGNVSVGGPGGALSVTGAVLSGNTVTYTVAAPGGSWDPLDAGSYSIGINASVKDMAGNTVAAQADAHAFDVAFTPAAGVGALSLSDDTGASATDFLTNAAAQTIRATLSKALAGGDVIEGSLDNGATWTVITDKVAGTALAWDTLLGSSGTIVVKVTGANGVVGATASHAYTLDTTAPAQAVTDVALSVDSGAAGDFVTNVAAQTLTGKLGAPLGAGESVEVSLDGGAHWTDAAATGADWSLAGIALPGAGTLQVRVSDAAGNHGTPWEHTYRLDTTAPVAGTPVRSDLVVPEGASFTFTVTYDDGGAGIDPATIGTGNVGVTGPAGALTVTGAVAAGNTVTYTVAAPGGAWDPLDAGSYTIAISASVKDLAGNTVAADAAAHAFDVVFSTAPAVSALALSDDTGSSADDFLTNAAAQTVHAALSKALAAGDVVEGSLDNGATWTDITGKVAGTALAWDGVTLAGSGTIVIKVTGANGLAGAPASHAYTLDTALPAQAITDVALSVDSGAAGDFVTNVAAQALTGKLGAPLGAGESVEVSLDGGGHWTAASVAGTDWSLAGLALSGSGTLQVRVSDAAGNHGAPWQHAYLLDTAAPTAGTPVRANLADPAGASFTFTVTYEDGGAGIDPASIGTGNVSVTGPAGSLTVLAATASGNTVTYTVQAPGGSWDPLDAGSYTIGIDASVKDLAGNTVAANAAAHVFTVGVNSAPVLGGTFATAQIADDARATPFAGVTVADADGDAVTLTISYAAANGTLSGAGLAGAAGSYTLSGSAAEVQAALRALVFVPTANQVASGTVATVFALAASDGRATAGNDATVVTTAPVAPTASIALSDTALTAGETALLTVTFSEAVTGLTAAALTLPGGTLGTLASSDGGRTWSATFTPGADVAQGAQQVVLDMGAVRDAGGLAGSGSASGPSYTVNTVRPTATLAIDDTSLTAGETARLTIVFSEAVTGFTTADLAVANGTLSNLASLDGGITWTATLTPAANVFAGAGTVRLDLAGVRNAAGNAGSGTAQSNPFTVDTLPPGTDPDPTPGNGTIGGVPVVTGTLVDPLTGLVNNTLAVPTVPSSQEGLATIPLAASANGVTSTLTIGLPGGAGLQASGPATLLDNATARQDLANRIGTDAADDADGGAMAQHGADFLQSLGADVLVQSMTLAPQLAGAGNALARIMAAAVPAARPDIAITGGTDARVALALVIDAGGLPAGTTLQLNDVQFAAVSGAVTLRGGAGDNFVVGDGASQNILLGEGDDTLFGGGGDDVIGSTGGNDALHGDAGNDTLAGGIGNDQLHGGAGDDVLQGGRSAAGDWQFVLKGGALQALHQTATFAPDAIETLAPAALDGSAAGLAFLAAGQGTLTDIALLYQAAFGRAPDVDGLNYFLAHGVGAADLARAFATSAEWSAAGLDTLSDTAFVQKLYGEVLDRAGDAAGVAFWAGKLGEGAIARADVLLALALSDEHRGHYADGIVVAAANVEHENGWIAGSGDDRLDGGAGSDLLVGGDGIDTVVYAGKLADYRFLLGADGAVRVADKANADVDTLSGIELGEFGDGTVDLAFTQAGSATLKTLGLLYQAVLDRAGDVGGFAWWSGLHLDAGALVAAFTGSAEFAAHYGALSDADFVAALYANSSLDASAAGGSAAWVAMLHDHTRAELVGSWIAQDAVLQAQSGTQGLWLV